MRGRWIRLGALGAVAASIIVALAFTTRFGSDPNLVTSPLIGRPAPDLTLPLLDSDGDLRLGDHRGEIVVVNFFASWCLQCRDEHDDLVATANAFAGSGVTFIQVVYQDQAADARSFLDELGWSEATIYAEDPGSRAAIAFGVFGVPETYFVSPEGTVVGKIQGESNAVLLGETIDKIRRGEAPGSQVVGEVQSGPGD